MMLPPWRSATPSEPGPVATALVQLATAFVLANIGAVVGTVGGSSRAGTAGAAVGLAAAAFVGGVFLHPGRGPLAARVGDLAWAFSVVYLGVGAGALLADDDVYAAIRAHATDSSVEVHLKHRVVALAALVALVYAVALYLRRRRVWVQTAAVASLVTALLAALDTRAAVPDVVGGLYLVILAATLAVGAWHGFLRPVASGYVLAATVGGVAAWLLIGANRPLGTIVAFVLLGCVFVGAVRARRASLLAATPVLVFVLVPRALVPDLGVQLGIGLAFAGLGAALAMATTRLAAGVLGPRPRIGGLLGVATFSSLIGLTILDIGKADAGSVAGYGCVAVVFVAAASARRWYAVVLTGLALLGSAGSLIDGVAGGPVRGSLVLAGAGVVALAVLLSRPATAADPAQDAGWQPLRTVTVGSGYPRVFPALRAAAAESGFGVVLADHGSGRVLLSVRSGAAVDVRLWGSDAETTVAVGVRPPVAADVVAAVDALLYKAATTAADARKVPEPRAGGEPGVGGSWHA